MFDNNNNNETQIDNSNALEISSLTVDDTSKVVVPFKRDNNNNLAFNNTLANIIDATEGGGEGGIDGGVAGGSDDNGGVDSTPVIDSSNSNDNQHLTAILNFNLNVV